MGRAGDGKMRGVRDDEQLVQRARALAESLDAEMRWRTAEAGYGGYWEAISPEARGRIYARATGGLSFLERVSGPTQWIVLARSRFDNQGDRQSMESGARAVGDILREWADAVEAGFEIPRWSRQEGLRAIAAADLMGQVRTLLERGDTHPAAPIVLAGAALEMALRATVDQLELEAKGPGLSNLGNSLRAADVITVQEGKELLQIAGLRNAAAHGQLDELSVERAGLMEQQVNLFLARLEIRVATSRTTVT